jgi:hypothetical protein
VDPGNSISGGTRLFFISDRAAGKRFLVDTGSSFSILPHRASKPTSGPSLHSANGSCIRCWGYRRQAVNFAGSEYSWNFLLADVKFPILGIDFLKHFQLVVDVHKEQLLSRSSLAASVGGDVFAVAGQAAQWSAEASSPWSTLLSEFPRISQSFDVQTSPSPGMQHTIMTTGRPTTGKFQWLDPVCLAAAKAEFQKMMDAGVVRRSSSCWSSPLHMLAKKGGGWCLAAISAALTTSPQMISTRCRIWTIFLPGWTAA